MGECGIARTDTRLQRFVNAGGYVPQSKIWRLDGGASGISAPRCGVQQRMFYWNRSCSTAIDGWDAPIPSEFNRFFPQEGTEVDALDYDHDGNIDNDYCLIREPRRMVTSCPIGMRCSADGECNDDDAAPLIDQFPPPPPNP